MPDGTHHGSQRARKKGAGVWYACTRCTRDICVYVYMCVYIIVITDAGRHLRAIAL